MKFSVQERVAREEKAHENSSVPEESCRLKNRFHHIWAYPSRRRVDEAKSYLLRDINDRFVLDYGCGWGGNSLEYYQKGAIVTGIDISDMYIDSANARVLSKGFDAERCKFIKMDAHNLRFEDESFDFIVGDAILHHLDTVSALSEMYRVLKPGGRAILFEPLAGNPLLKLFRLMTPKARTIDEMPFSGKHLRSFAAQHPWQVEHAYCGVLEAPMAVLTSMLLPGKPDNFLLDGADKLEKWMVKNRILLSWNQYVLMNFRK